MTSRRERWLLDHLTERDLALLADLERFRLLTSRHVQRLHFAADRTEVAATRATNRALNRLRQLGLVTTLQRRSGGVRRGSAGLVWHLAAAGERLQASRRGDRPVRRRLSEPSWHFIDHTLAVADLAVALIEATSQGRGELLQLHTEPDSWQPSLTRAGTATMLKPDLHVVLGVGDFEQHWFVEIDLATEHAPVIRRQADAYRQHRASGRYQAEHGVYPAVLWVAPDGRRTAALTRALAPKGPRASAEGLRACSRACALDELLGAS